MRKFDFRLQKLLDIRKWREKSSQQKLVTAQRESEKAKQELDQKLEEVEVQHKNSLQQVSNGFKAGDALTGSLFTQKLHREATQKRQKANVCNSAVEQKREELIEISRDRQAIEKLRDKRMTEYIQETERKAQTILDDDAIRRHHAKTRGNRNNGS